MCRRSGAHRAGAGWATAPRLTGDRRNRRCPVPVLYSSGSFPPIMPQNSAQSCVADEFSGRILEMHRSPRSCRPVWPHSLPKPWFHKGLQDCLDMGLCKPVFTPCPSPANSKSTIPFPPFSTAFPAASAAPTSAAMPPSTAVTRWSCLDTHSWVDMITSSTSVRWAVHCGSRCVGCPADPGGVPVRAASTVLSLREG